MDSRTKIIPAEQARRVAAAGATVVSGCFDPLLAWHAERLESLKREGSPLLVMIAAPEDPILPARARAELVAGLKIVDYVLESNAAVTPHFRLDEEEKQILEDLIERVHARQSAALPAHSSSDA